MCPKCSIFPVVFRLILYNPGKTAIRVGTKCSIFPIFCTKTKKVCNEKSRSDFNTCIVFGRQVRNTGKIHPKLSYFLDWNGKIRYKAGKIVTTSVLFFRFVYVSQGRNTGEIWVSESGRAVRYGLSAAKEKTSIACTFSSWNIYTHKLYSTKQTVSARLQRHLRRRAKRSGAASRARRNKF